MSIYFHIYSEESLSPEKVLDSLNRPEVEISYPEAVDMKMPFKGTYRFFVPGKSTRGVTFSHEDDQRYDVGINMLGSPEDYQLTLDIAHAVGRRLGQAIDSEESGPLFPDEFREIYGAEWVAKNQTEGVSILKKLVKEGDTLSLTGCLRTCYIGPETFRQVEDGSGDETQLYFGLLEVIRKVQYFDEDEFKVPGLFEVTEEDGTKWEYIVIFPGESHFIYRAEYVVFLVNDDYYHRVPFQRLKKVSHKKFRRIDELQYLVEPMGDTEFIGLMEALLPGSFFN